MNNTTLAIGQILSMVASFYIGRYSCLALRNRYLEAKRNELNAYREELLKIERALEEKDAAIRKKWQSMVSDISKYQASMIDGDTGKWSDWDDAYLNSWSSAEK